MNPWIPYEKLTYACSRCGQRKAVWRSPELKERKRLTLECKRCGEVIPHKLV